HPALKGAPYAKIPPLPILERMRGGGTFYAGLLLLFVALAEVGILHLLAAAAAGCAVLCHFDLGQVALAAIDVVAALADIADDAFVLHGYHLSLQAVCPQGRFFIQAGLPARIYQAARLAPSLRQASWASSSGASLQISPSSLNRTAPSPLARSHQSRIHWPSPQP